MSIGFKLIPSIIWEIYKMLFTIPNFRAEFNLEFGIIGLVIGVICICGSAIFSAYKELSKMPAVLMRPKTPKKGKKILLEKIHFIWNKLNFSNKITIRNLFRYKIRALVTIIGIAGCTALILAGFGLRDSISDIVNYQFEHVSKYDKLITLKSDANVGALADELQANKNINDLVQAKMETVNIYNEDKNYEITLVVADNQEELRKVISLNDINNEYKEITLEDNKVVLSEKLAKLLKVEKNDDVIFKDDNDEEHKVQVMAKAENYINNYAYMTKNTFEKIFGKYNTNTFIITTDDLSNELEDELDKNILNKEEVASIISSNSTINSVNDMMGSLNSVVVILVVASAILSFVIMYNLSNINISERQREIATLKVLGFYDNEVDNYITKENIILTILGIGIGLFLGVYLAHFIITSCETDNLMFIRHVNTISYIYASLITVIFTVIVNVITHFNLKKINMIDSLKSVE